MRASTDCLDSGRSMVRFRKWVPAGRLPFNLDELGRRRFTLRTVERLVAEVERYKLEVLKTDDV